MSNKYILLIEDSTVDYEIAKRAFSKAGIELPLKHFESGQKALDFLHDFNEDKPELIFLDLNMPGIGGLDLLAKIKSDNFLKKIPTIILTTSDNDKDVSESYKNGANCYLRKPTQPEDFVAMAGDIRNFWLKWVQLPELVR